jgi:hypothetical protein
LAGGGRKTKLCHYRWLSAMDVKVLQIELAAIAAIDILQTICN